jgi:FixJ family two-component response regulator
VLDNADGWPAYNVGDLTLTKREAEIAGFVSQGLANKEVAGLLGVVEGTVKLTCITSTENCASQIGLSSCCERWQIAEKDPWVSAAAEP